MPMPMPKPKPKLTKFKTETIDGADVDIFVNVDGEFVATVPGADGEQIEASTMRMLVEKLRRTSRARRNVSLPATLLRRTWHSDAASTFVDVTVTGVHASNGNVLYRVDSESARGSSQLCAHNEHLMRRLSAEQRAEYLRLEQAKRATTEQLNLFHASLKIDAKSELAKLAASADTATTPAPTTSSKARPR